MGQGGGSLKAYIAFIARPPRRFCSKLGPPPCRATTADLSSFIGFASFAEMVF